MHGKDVLTFYQLKKTAFILFMYVCIPLTPVMALEYRDIIFIDKLLKSCYKDNDSCNSALTKIHNYKKNAAINKKFSCQTRLLGLEANLIKATNSNFKRKEVKNIIDAIKKYC